MFWRSQIQIQEEDKFPSSEFFLASFKKMYIFLGAALLDIIWASHIFSEVLDNNNYQ